MHLPNKAQCAESIAKQFGYDAVVDIESAQLSFFEEKILPVNGVNDPYEFVIESLGDSFIPMNSIKLYCRCKILLGGQPITADHFVVPSNNILSTLWKSIELKLNGTHINQGGETNIGFKHYNETILSYESLKSGGSIVKSHRLTYNYKDDVREFDIMGEVPCDFFRSDNYLAPNNVLSLVFSRHSDEFSLNAAESINRYTIQMEEISLYLRRICLQPEVISKVISPSLPQRYVSKFSKMHNISIPRGMKNIRKIITVGDVLPKQVIISQVPREAYYGKLDQSPTYYRHFNLCRLNLKINDKQVPSIPLTPDFENELIAREMMHLQRNVGKGQHGRFLDINHDQFLTGITIFPFDLNPDQCNGEHIHLSSTGTLEIEVDWARSLQQNIMILVHLIYNQVVTVPPNGGSPLVEIF